MVENAEPKFVKFPDEMLIKIRDSSLESRNPSGTLLSLLVSEFLYIIYQQKKGTLIVIGLPGYQGVQRAILFEEAQRIGKPRAVRGLRESQDAAVLDGAGLGLGFRPLELYYRTPTTEPYFLEAPTFCFHYRVVSGPHIPTFLARFYRGQPRGGERSRSNGSQLTGLTLSRWPTWILIDVIEYGQMHADHDITIYDFRQKKTSQNSEVKVAQLHGGSQN